MRAPCTDVLYGYNEVCDFYMTIVSCTTSLNRELLISCLLENKVGIPRAFSASLPGTKLRSPLLKTTKLGGLPEQGSQVFLAWDNMRTTAYAMR